MASSRPPPIPAPVVPSTSLPPSPSPSPSLSSPPSLSPSPLPSPPPPGSPTLVSCALATGIQVITGLACGAITFLKTDWINGSVRWGVAGGLQAGSLCLLLKSSGISPYDPHPFRLASWTAAACSTPFTEWAVRGLMKEPQLPLKDVLKKSGRNGAVVGATVAVLDYFKIGWYKPPPPPSSSSLTSASRQ